MRYSLFVIVTGVFLASCTEPRQPFTEKKLVIASKQTVRISQLDLSITNNGCGRKWMADGGEKAYCDVVVKRGEISFHMGEDSKPLYVGELEIRIDKMNPWGRVEDSIPPGGCQVWVRRTEGR